MKIIRFGFQKCKINIETVKETKTVEFIRFWINDQLSTFFEIKNLSKLHSKCIFMNFHYDIITSLSLSLSQLS